MFNPLRSIFRSRISTYTVLDDPDRRSTDRQLCLNLMELFERDLAYTRVSGIHFYVRNGRVTLHGMVSSDAERHSLVQFVDDVEDVISVTDNLTVYRLPEFGHVMRTRRSLVLA